MNKKCIDCGKDNNRQGTARYCLDCSEIHRAKNNEQYRQRNQSTISTKERERQKKNRDMR
jgi:hypothetical protein